MSIQNYPGSVVAQPWISGLLVSNDATTPNTKLNISAGICRDSNNIVDLTVGVNNPNFESQYVAAPLVLNAAVTGANGIDQGTFAANAFYAVYVIGDSTYQRTTASLLSLSSNSTPLMPAGYDSYRLVGYALTDGSIHFVAMNQTGVSNDRMLTYATPQSIGANTATSYSFDSLSNAALFAPITANQIVTMYVDYTASVAGNTFNASNTGTTDQVTMIAAVAGATAHLTQTFRLQPAVVSSQPGFYVKMTAGTATLYVVSVEFFV